MDDRDLGYYPTGSITATATAGGPSSSRQMHTLAVAVAALSKLSKFIRPFMRCFVVCFVVVCLTHYSCVNDVRSMPKAYQVLRIKRWMPKAFSKSRYYTVLNILLKECSLYSYQHDGLLRVSLGLFHTARDMFLSLLVEFTVLVFTVSIFPILSAYWDIFKPNWVVDVEERAKSKLFYGNSAMPELLSCADLSHQDQRAGSGRQQLVVDTFVTVANASENTNDSTVRIPSPIRPPMSPRLREKWHVFDPVFGVVPKTVYDRWREAESSIGNSSASSSCNSENSSSSGRPRKSLPPPRYSQELSGLQSATNGAKAATEESRSSKGKENGVNNLAATHHAAAPDSSSGMQDSEDVGVGEDMLQINKTKKNKKKKK